MKLPFPRSTRTLTILGLLVISLVVGLSLFISSLQGKSFNEEQLVWDAIWLDAWALLFALTVLIIWGSPLSWRVKAPLLIGTFSCYGLVTVSLFFNGTPFGMNGCWGDQKFRMAMILKFSTWWIPGDFYYKDLPSFYPPVYYYLLSLGARILSVEAFKMIKVGSIVIYLVGPTVLYLMWRQMLSRNRALLVVLATFLFCSQGKIMPLSAPHAFVANAMFIPWWLYYIEQVKRPLRGRRQYLVGALIGAAIFSTYIYPFFIGAFLLLLRATFLRKWVARGESQFRWKSALTVLSFSAVLSAPFWLPLLISLITFGSGASERGWHHMGSTGILFSFQSFSIPGMAFLAALYYLLRHRVSPVYRALLMLTGATMVFYLPGAFLGAVGEPVNLIKANEFMIVMAGPVVGLAAAAMVRAGRLHHRRGLATVVVIGLLSLVFLHNFNGLIKHPMVKTARTTRAPGCGVDPGEMSSRVGSVFLTAQEELFAFYPVYAFIAINQHYSHPASQYLDRYRMLHLLQGISDPGLFHLALRHNRFDAVDYFLPRQKEGQFQILLALSNYPNRYSHQTLVYDTTLLSDTTLFRKEKGEHLYKVLDNAQQDNPIPVSTPSDWQQLLRLHLLRGYLNDTGQELLDKRLDIDRAGWRRLIDDETDRSFGDRIELLDAYAVRDGDSLHLLLAFYVADHFYSDQKVFVHLYPGHGETMFDNFDFTPTPPVRSWKKGDIVFNRRTILCSEDYERLRLGFFWKEQRLGKGVWMSLRGTCRE
ncbi:MAG: arabinofuranosyltransferase [bacterium]